MAERRYLASTRSDQPATGQPPPQPLVNLTDYRVISGHKHAN
jgi:hypothetical protein